MHASTPRIGSDDRSRDGSGLQGRLVSAALRFVAAAALFAAVPGCDNVACVFGEGCTEDATSGSIGTQPATRLSTGVRLSPSRPTVTRFLPGDGAQPTTPIVVEFSESMASSSVTGAFELLEQDSPVATPLNATLTGDGRVAILTGLGLTEGSSYQVLYAEGEEPTDLTGQTLSIGAERLVGSFSVTSSPSDTPALLGTFPEDGDAEASPIATLVAVFDRPLNPATVNATTFRVEVDGGAPPTNTGPITLQLEGAGGASLAEPRVYFWRAQDSLGNRLSFGDGAMVDLTLSNAAPAPMIEDDEGMALPQTTVSFTTSDLPPPSAVSITSTPSDAIGIANLDGTSPLQIQVDFAVPASTGDVLEIYLVGRSLEEDEDGLPFDTALLRTFPLADGAVSTLLGEPELDLASSTAPVAGRFRDGEVNLGFLVLSGDARSTVRVLDADPATAEQDDPVLDTTAPQLESLGQFGMQVGEFRSGLRDLVVNGVANEELRSVEVTAQIGLVSFDNGALPPVASFDQSTGGFLAATVPLGVLDAADLPATAEITIYDRALNAAPTAMVPFHQLGASGPAAALPGPDVLVTVYDDETLLPIENARVFTHEDDAGVVSAVATGTTDALGRTSLASAVVGETIVTVDADGYDLFSFHGAPTARLDVPLSPTGPATAVVTPVVSADFEEISMLENAVVDSRVPFPIDDRKLATSCFFNPFAEETACTFDPYAVDVRRLGALVHQATLTPSSEAVYSADSFLRGFGWFAPRPALAPGGGSGLMISVDSLLSDVGTSDEERAIDVPLRVLDTAGATGVDLGDLVGGLPSYRVEALSPGLPDAPAVGPGVAFDIGGGSWNLRGAYPGAADGIVGGGGDQEGSLVVSGAIEGDLFLAAEVADSNGNRSGARPRLSVAPGTLELSAVPAVSAPVGNTGGPSFDLEFDDVVPDALGQPGIYRAVLVDDQGRSWSAWRLDPADAGGGTVRIHLPDIALGGGTALDPGPLAISVTSWSLPAPPGSADYAGFDPTEFVWSDIRRQRDRRSVAAPVLVTQP